MAQNDALVRFYFQVNPDELSDDEWTKAISQIDFVLLYNGTRTPTKEE